MNKLADSPAFPAELYDPWDHSPPRTILHSGMTLRQFAAIHAMQGLLANSSPEQFVSPEGFAMYAAKCSDALLAELAKTTSQSC